MSFDDTLAILSILPDQIELKALRLTISFVGYTNFSSLDFTVEIRDSCSSISLSIDAVLATSLNFQYEIGSSAHSVEL